MGGTVDPAHIAHLIIAEVARFRLELDKVVSCRRQPMDEIPARGDRC